MKFTSATILIDNYGTDKVYLKTTLPSPYPAGVDPFTTTPQFGFVASTPFAGSAVWGSWSWNSTDTSHTSIGRTTRTSTGQHYYIMRSSVND